MRLFITVFFGLLSSVNLALAEDPKISDDLIYDHVNRALITDRELGARPLTVKVNEGNVVVTGFVENEKLQKKVEKIVKKVKGVKKVDNQVEVRFPEASSFHSPLDACPA